LGLGFLIQFGLLQKFQQLVTW